MPIVAVGEAALPLSARRTVTVLVWYLGVQLAVNAPIFVARRLALTGSPETRAHYLRVVLSLRAPVAMLGYVCAAWIGFILIRQSFPAGAWPTVVATLGRRPSSWRAIFLGIAAGVALPALPFLAATGRLTGSSDHSFHPVSPILAGFPGQLAFVVVAVAVAPLIEEFLFRGFLLTGFSNALGRWPAMLITTILFTLTHVPRTGGRLPPLVSIALLGTLALVARMRTRSLWPGMAFHASYNATVSTLLLAYAT